MFDLFRSLTDAVDSVNDAIFGENIIFQPIKNGAADPARAAITVVGVPLTQRDVAANAGGPQGGGFREAMATSDVLVSVATPAIADARLRRGDRCMLLDRGSMAYEINRVYPLASNRSEVHLTRVA